MKYSKEEVMQYVLEEDVKFIRLAFCDVFGRQKNISILPEELSRAFQYGIAFDASSIAGFGDETHSDLFLHPEPETLRLLPWRPEHGRVVQIFCHISYPDGTPFECDTRSFLKKAIEDARTAGYQFFFGAEQEFYLFELDEKGCPTKTPYDKAGYMDIAPDDKGENIRREICLTLEQMGIRPESSHHEAGPGQNEIDFRYSDALPAADQTMLFRTITKIVSYRNGLSADFTPKPLPVEPGNGFHINISIQPDETFSNLGHVIGGILEKIREMTVFFNFTENSYQRFGNNKAPMYISWAGENRSQLIRIPATFGEYRRAELRSPDPLANPYLSFALLIYAGLYGLQNNSELPAAADINLFQTDVEALAKFEKLPETLASAKSAALKSPFIKRYVPAAILSAYCEN